MSYEALLAQMQEVQAMTKALPKPGEGDDAAKIQAAAADGAGGAGGGKGGNGGGNTEENDDPDGDEMMGKSLKIKLDDGTEVDALDGTELVKSLIARMDTDAGVAQQVIGGALSMIKAQGEIIAAQDKVLKSLQADVAALGRQGAGRRSVVSVAPAPAQQSQQQMAKSMPGEEFMAKSLEAQKAGRISGMDVSIIEGYLNSGAQVPERYVSRVMGTK